MRKCGMNNRAEGSTTHAGVRPPTSLLEVTARAMSNQLSLFQERRDRSFSHLLHSIAAMNRHLSSLHLQSTTEGEEAATKKHFKSNACKMREKTEAQASL